MRHPAPSPESLARKPLIDGYQLCARCGNVLVEGDIVDVVSRLSNWLIYSHPAVCSENAVHGWQAVRYAEGIRNKPNAPTFRPAEPLEYFGIMRPCVCTLDDEHTEAELQLADFDFSSEAPTNGDDLRTILATSESRFSGRAKRSIEEHIITVIDSGALALTQTVDLWLDVMWTCRRKTYATFREAPEQESSPAFYDLGRSTSLTVPTFSHTSAPQKYRVAKDVLSFDFGPEPVSLGYSSNDEPKRYTWKKILQKVKRQSLCAVPENSERPAPQEGCNCLPCCRARMEPEPKRPLRTARLKKAWVKEKQAGDELVQYLVGWWIVCGARSQESKESVFYRGMTKDEGDLYRRYSEFSRCTPPSVMERSETASLGPITEGCRGEYLLFSPVGAFQAVSRFPAPN